MKTDSWAIDEHQKRVKLRSVAKRKRAPDELMTLLGNSEDIFEYRLEAKHHCRNVM